MYELIKKLMLKACSLSLKYPYLVLACVLLVSVPAVIEVQKVFVDPNLVRLLPKDSRAAVNTRTLSSITGDGGYFTMMFTSDEKNHLIEAADAAALRIRPLEDVHTVEYEYPVEFLERYRYHLIPNDYLVKILDNVVGWKSELSPAGFNLLADEIKTDVQVQDEQEASFEGDIRHYASLSRYHLSADEKNLGIIIRTSKGIDEWQQVVELYNKLTNIAAEIKTEYPVEIGIAGTHRNKTDEYYLINSGIRTGTMISAVLIFIVTVIGFRSFRAAFTVILPLSLGVLWGFAFIPTTVQSLNLITSFLAIILSAMGIDYAIHLVKRVEQELLDKPFAEAFMNAYRSTGPAVFVSGITTAFALFILAISNCLGFSEFGIISAMVIISILASVFIAMPAILVLAHRFGFLRGRDHRTNKAIILSRRGTITALVLLGICLLLAATSLRFDASFRNLEFEDSTIEGAQEGRAVQRKVYSSTFTPGAIFVANDLENLDNLLDIFEKRIHEKFYLTNPQTNIINGEEIITYTTNETTIEAARSVREYAPRPENFIWKERLELLASIQEEIREGSWIERIENSDRKKWIEELRDWEGDANPKPVTLEELHPMMTSSLLSKDGEGRYLVAVFPNVDRKNAQNAIRFTDEIYELVPESAEERAKLGIAGILGPVGEVPIYAEIIKTVKGEILWLGGLTFFGVFILIWFEFLMIREALFVMIPLVAGLIFTFGIMALIGMNLNIFNSIMIPALLGLSVDNGVHMFSRWKESKGDTKGVLSELFTTLFVCSFTTMLGYFGMVFVAHPGLRSIGWLAILGMGMIWITTVIVLPSLFQHFMKKHFLRQGAQEN